MVIKRKYWIANIEKAWQERSIVWLSGVRRAGKTILSQSLPRVDYFDCELPRVRIKMAEPGKFLKAQRGKRIVLDEIHRLDNPSELLKIAADHFPTTKIIATGSSSLSASAKFKDTLAGRKTELWLTPMISEDLNDLKGNDIGLLWEHYVLNELHANLQSRQIRYWRDKQGHEVDFIILRRGRPPLAIEAKWSCHDFDPANVKVFMRYYPQSQAFVAVNDLIRPLEQTMGGICLTFATIPDLVRLIGK